MKTQAEFQNLTWLTSPLVRRKALFHVWWLTFLEVIHDENSRYLGARFLQIET